MSARYARTLPPQKQGPGYATAGICPRLCSGSFKAQPMHGPYFELEQTLAIKWLNIHSQMGGRLAKRLNNPEKSFTISIKYHATLERRKSKINRKYLEFTARCDQDASGTLIGLAKVIL